MSSSRRRSDSFPPISRPHSKARLISVSPPMAITKKKKQVKLSNTSRKQEYDIRNEPVHVKPWGENNIPIKTHPHIDNENIHEFTMSNMLKSATQTIHPKKNKRYTKSPVNIGNDEPRLVDIYHYPGKEPINANNIFIEPVKIATKSIMSKSKTNQNQRPKKRVTTNPSTKKRIYYIENEPRAVADAAKENTFVDTVFGPKSKPVSRRRQLMMQRTPTV